MTDLRYASRVLRKNPLFTLTAVLSLAVGIGATTAVFTLANGLLFRAPTGVADANRLVDLVVTTSDAPGITPVPYPEYTELRRHVDTLDGIYAYELDLAAVSVRVDDGGAERAFADLVTNSYFEVLGVRPALGRTLSSADSEQAGGAPLVVLSDRFWSRRFNADPRVVDRVVRINGYPMTIVGVADRTFHGSSVVAPDMWMPVAMADVVHPGRGSRLLTGDEGWLMLGARLKPGISRAQASAQVAAIGRSLTHDRPSPAVNAPGTHDVSSGSMRWSAESSSPIPYGLRGLAAAFLAILLAVVALVLVIACTNIAGVLLARALARRREIAVRAALGAHRLRIIRQLLAEVVVLFALGGCAGVLLARVLIASALRLLPAVAVPVDLSAPLDGRVLAFSVVLSACAALAAGLVPALQATKTDVASTLKSDSQAFSDRLRLRSLFVTAQVAMSVVLVIAAALFVRALQNVTAVDRGFDAAGVDAVSLDVSMAGYAGASSATVARNLLARVQAMPGVTSATLSDRAPGPGGRSLGVLSVPGFTAQDGRPFPFVNWTLVEPGFFTTLRIPLIAGRDFSETDGAGAQPVVIVSDAAAKRFWPGRDPVGQSVLLHAAAQESSAAPQRMVVTGVARDLKFAGRGGAPRFDIYVPLRQQPSQQITVLARHATDRSQAQAIAALVSSMDRNLPVLSAQTLEAQQTGPVDTQLRISAAITGSVGLVGVLLAGLGTYGVMAYLVARRTREIAIRIALGAHRSDVVALVLRDGSRLVLSGSAVGVLLSLAVARWLSASQLSVPPPDVWVLGSATLLVLIVGLSASLVPLVRAIRIEPHDALRTS